MYQKLDAALMETNLEAAPSRHYTTRQWSFNVLPPWFAFRLQIDEKWCALARERENKFLMCSPAILEHSMAPSFGS